MATVWEPVDIDFPLNELANYEAKADWLEFDCVCMDKNAPDYEKQPYDFTLQNLAVQRFTCPRCGRQYRLEFKIEVEMYTPIAIKYPNVPDKMPPETLGLRVKEEV